MTSVSKNVYTDKLDDIANNYNNRCHSAFKMKPVDVKSNTYINSSKEINNKDPKLKIDDIVSISKSKNIFEKGYTPMWSEDFFWLRKFKNAVPWTSVINDINGEETFGTFYQKELQKENEKKFRFEKVIKKIGDKLCHMKRTQIFV